MKTSLPALSNWTSLLFFSVALNSCGGGGGDGGSSSPSTYTVGGMVSGLTSGYFVALLDNGSDSTTVTSNTTFTFPTTLASGAKYAVTVGTQPAGQTCTVAAGSGVMGAADITNVSIACATPHMSFSFGAEETVFSSSTDSCEPLDVPDTPAHAVRLADGSLILEDGDAPRNYAMFGATFSTLKRSCTPILVSDDLPTADSFDNQEWIESVYSDGTVIHGFIDNEFHDPIAPDCKPGDSSPGNPCWYNSIGYAVSSDGGHTFTHAAPPAHLLAPAPQQWYPQGPPAPPPPYGYFEPSNIVHALDNFYYAVFRGNTMNNPPQVCLIRTQTLHDPTSWRAWDGSGFSLRMTDPYTGPAPSLCTGVAGDLAQPTLTYNTYLGKYMMVGSAVLGNPSVCGAAYALSSDLIHWTAFQIIKTGYFSFAPCLPPGGNGYLTVYFSIIDHSDTTTNFERPGQTPYLYYTRIQWQNGGVTLNRDLVRVPVVITAN